jgi:hypothetical protein
MGDHTDTTEDADVSDTRAPAVFQLSEAGDMGDTVVALIAHKDQFLIGFTATETWVLSGDPHTGRLHRISDRVGIVGANAWCVNHDTIYFLSSHGLYSMQADGSGLKALSEDKVPEELTGITDTATTLTYNHADRGVYIHFTTGVNWFYDTERDAFWPFTDSSQSHVLIGPLRIGSALERGMIMTVHGVTAKDSGTVNWRFVPGDTAEEAAENGKTAITADLAGNDFSDYISPSYGGWAAGRSNAAWVRCRCIWACLWLRSSSDWAYESVILETQPFGRAR